MSSSNRKRLNSQPQTPRRPKKPYQESSLCHPTEESYHDPPEANDPSDLVIPHGTAQLTGAHGFSISGSPFFANINGENNVINYGGTHGLEKMETFVSFAARYNSAEQDPERQCHPGTREATLERIQNWIDDPSTPERIFWLHGPAGAGKSAIAQTIARANPQEKVVVTFFFYRSDLSRNDGNRLFTTLAWQLAFAIPAVKPFIVDALEKQPDLPRTDVETQFDQLIVRPFQLLGQHIPQSLNMLPVVIIDGVDECADEKLQRRILTVIGKAAGDRRLPLRFLICSRPEADIKGTIDRFQPPPLATDLSKLDDANRDIEKYLREEFSRVASERDLDPTLWPGEAAIWQVVFKSSGYFIFATTVIKCVGDLDSSPQTQLDIILGLQSISSTSPFALLDGLYAEILKRQVDQDFLKTFLALLVGRNTVQILSDSPTMDINLADDDAILMNISKKELHIKLRRMRSLLSFEPHIDAYHRSFFDFLLDPSRSHQYHVSEEGGITRYLELIVDWIVQYADRVINHPECHKAYHFRPNFVNILDKKYAAFIKLPVEGWLSALQPLLHLQDRLLGLPNFNSTWDILPCRECFAFYTMRCLLLRFALLQGYSYATAESAEQYASSTPSILTVIERNGFDMGLDLDISLSSLFVMLRNSKSIESPSSTQIVDLVRAILRFGYAEVAANVLSVADAQELMDVMDRVINDEKLLGQFRPCEIDQATRLALRLFTKTQVLPRSLFLEMKIPREISGFRDGKMEPLLHSVFIGRILDRKFSVPLLGVIPNAWMILFVDLKYRDETMRQWRKRVNPSPGIIFKAMLAVAKTFKYFHSMGIVLDRHGFNLDHILLDCDSMLCAKLMVLGTMSDLEERWTFSTNIFAFGCFFYETYFDVEIEDSDRCRLQRNVIVERPSEPKIDDNAWNLIQRCCAEDPKSRPTIDEVVQEMEAWTLV